MNNDTFEAYTDPSDMSYQATGMLGYPVQVVHVAVDEKMIRRIVREELANQYKRRLYGLQRTARSRYLP